MTFTIGQEISWINYKGLDTPPTELKGTVTKTNDLDNTAIVEEHTTGEPFTVRELPDGVFVSGNTTEPNENAGPLKFTGEPIGTPPAAPAPVERKPDPGIPVGILYYGPAYQHAVDMLVEMFGKQLAGGVGHVPHPDDGHDPKEPETNPQTLYCFFVETESQIDDMEHTLKHHKNARHFDHDIYSPVPDDVIDGARSTLAAGELPLLTRLQ